MFSFTEQDILDATDNAVSGAVCGVYGDMYAATYLAERGTISHQTYVATDDATIDATRTVTWHAIHDIFEDYDRR
jgi:hypothetical protein